MSEKETGKSVIILKYIAKRLIGPLAGKCGELPGSACQSLPYSRHNPAYLPVSQI
jgi:hypothetical protein